MHFCGNNYQQIFRTAMGSPVSAVIANMVMEDVETRALNSFISDPKHWKRYDDTSVFLKQDMLTDLFNHINAVENSINFTMEKENDASFAFLDTLITRLERGQLSTKVYRKPGPQPTDIFWGGKMM